MLHLQVMRDCVAFHFVFTVLNQFLSTRIYVKLFAFHTKMISAKFLSGNVLLTRELQIDAKNSNLEKKNDSTLCMKSLSINLIS